MTPIKKAELHELRTEIRAFREEMVANFRDLTIRENDTRDRVARIEGSVAVIRWVGPGGIIAVVIGILFQMGILRVG